MSEVDRNRALTSEATLRVRLGVQIHIRLLFLLNILLLLLPAYVVILTPITVVVAAVVVVVICCPFLCFWC
jgi:uncharacterized membrane protein